MPIWAIISMVLLVLILVVLAVAAGGLAELLLAVIEGILEIICSVFTD